MKGKDTNETITYDSGKLPLASELAKITDDQIIKLSYVGQWLDVDFLVGCAKVLEANAGTKYPRDNWKLGTTWVKRLNSAQRHLLKYLRGEDFDPEFTTHHLCNMTVNLMMVYYWQRNKKGKDDREKTPGEISETS